MERVFGSLEVEFVTGDITKQPDIDAVVNAANADLAPGGGVAGAIHRAAGPGLYEECRPLAPIRPGQAVVTKGHGLPNPYIIHCLGPRYGQDEPAAALLGDCYRNALLRAEELGLASVAFPSISTGAFRYPVEEAAPVALSAVAQSAPALTSLKLVRFVLWGDETLRVYEAALASLVS